MTLCMRVVEGGPTKGDIVREPIQLSPQVLGGMRVCRRCGAFGAYRKIIDYQFGGWKKCPVCDGLGLLPSEVALSAPEGSKVSPHITLG